MSSFKVIVVGAGIAGLVTAILLRNNGFTVSVYEKAKKITSIGGGLLLYPNGVRILKLAGLTHILNQLGGKLNNITTHDATGNILLNDGLEAFYNLTNNYIAAVSRAELQDLLITALSDTIYMNHECTTLHESNGRVFLTFKNGATDNADMVIGADGINSSVRKIINQSSEDIKYNDVVTFGGILSRNDRIETDDRSLSLIFGINKFGFLAPMNNEKQMWLIFCKMAEKNYCLSQLRLKCKGWSKNIDAILNTPENEHSFAVEVGEVSPVTQWVKGRVALVGDAAHAFGPIQGQGTSAALEDAFILANCLQSYTHDIHHALITYQKIRKPIVDQFREIENKQQKIRLTSDEQLIQKINDMFSTSSVTQLFQPITKLTNDIFFEQQICLTKQHSYA